MAASPIIAPEEELASEKISVEVKLSDPKLVAPIAPVRNLLEEIFAGHEEFLGWTPD